MRLRLTYIQHLSKAESVKVVESTLQLGAPVTAEGPSQHFSKTEDLLFSQGSGQDESSLADRKDRLAVEGPVSESPYHCD